MDETIAVLALDAADFELLRRWDCKNILLKNHRDLETVAFTHDLPYTPEVWATVATGLSPEEHGVSGKTEEWDSFLLNSASPVIKRFPDSFRTRAGKIAERFGANTKQPSLVNDTVFSNGMLVQWPGITEANHFKEAQHWLSLINDGKLSERELRNRLMANTGMEFGWLMGTSYTDLPIVGIHSHVLDVAGHVYANRPDKLKEYYLFVDSLAKNLRDKCDELVIISDHGMQVGVLNDAHPGTHSWRAFIGTTLDEDLPSNVIEIAEWLKPMTSPSSNETVREHLDAPEDHLRELGYL